MDVTKSKIPMATKLDKITQLSYRDRQMRFGKLMPLVTPENLVSCFNELDGNKAVGIDGKTKAAYAENLEENIRNLVKRMKTLSYRPCAVREVLIPKANGKARPLGISNIEDKIVQLLFAKIKELMRMLSHRIEDKLFLRYVCRMLKAGKQTEAGIQHSDIGLPQGSILSPVMANVYAHYIIDLWFTKVVPKHIIGKVQIFRLGFTFYISKAKKGGLTTIKVKTSKKTIRVKLSNIKLWLQRSRFKGGLRDLWQIFCRKLRGQIVYFGVTNNGRSVTMFLQKARRLFFKWMNRRSQKRSFSWEKFAAFERNYPMPPVKIYHQTYQSHKAG